MHFLFLGLDTTLRFPIKELFIVEAIHSFDPEASSPSLDKNLLSLYVGERVVILGNLDFLKNNVIFGSTRSFFEDHKHLNNVKKSPK